MACPRPAQVERPPGRPRGAARPSRAPRCPGAPPRAIPPPRSSGWATGPSRCQGRRCRAPSSPAHATRTPTESGGSPRPGSSQSPLPPRSLPRARPPSQPRSEAPSPTSRRPGRKARPGRPKRGDGARQGHGGLRATRHRRVTSRTLRQPPVSHPSERRQGCVSGMLNAWQGTHEPPRGGPTGLLGRGAGEVADERWDLADGARVERPRPFPKARGLARVDHGRVPSGIVQQGWRPVRLRPDPSSSTGGRPRSPPSRRAGAVAKFFCAISGQA